ncbi:efflux RND transporter periplasmic adaptor subunit [Marinilabiliaceae bacterium JC017]|nr:efflux RND transporter periplasmic adaptor subunit [Marinilabiliaceae bacterium JC017]
MDRQIDKKPWWRQKMGYVIGITAFAIWGIYFIAFADHSRKVNMDLQKVTTSVVINDNFQDYISITGTVEPIKTIYLDVIEGGRVEKIMMEEGNMVQNGDPIAELSNTTLILEISNNEANVARAINELRTARLQMEMNAMELQNKIVQLEGDLLIQKRDFDNKSAFYKEGLVSMDEYLKAKTNYEASERSMKLLKESFRRDSVYRGIQIETLEGSAARMEKNQGIIRQRLDNLTIKAPVTGQLAALNLEEGQVINYGTRIGKINILDEFKLKAEIDEHYISRITKGLRANCQFPAKELSAKVTKIYAEVKEGRFNIDMEFDSSKVTPLRIGQTCRVRLELGDNTPALLLPRGSFFQSTGGQWVFVVNEDGIAEKRTIRLGRQNPKYFEVIDGLQAGEKVITSGYEMFGDAEKVVLKE